MLTVAGLLDGSERALHPDYVKDLNFKKAPKSKKKPQTKSLGLDLDE